jgi:adenylate kinase
MRRDPRVSLTVINLRQWYQQVTLMGRIVSIEDDPNLADIDRLAHRYTCRACESVYTFTPQQAKNLPRCEKCGGQLYQRPDDQPDVVARRIDVFLHHTAPLIDYYKAQRKLENIDGQMSIEEVRDDISRRLAALDGARRPVAGA